MTQPLSDKKTPMQLLLEQAAQCLRQGGVVAVPTETVYGLAADASQPDAIKRIFSIKGRPVDHPLIVYIGEISQIQNWARDIPEELWPLAKKFWPGPLTLVLKKQPHVSDLITGGQDTVALRIPNHLKALQLLVALNCGLVAPSANRFGCVSPTKAQHVIDELGTMIDGIVDGGDCDVGIESTILDLSTVNSINGQPTILRSGQISQGALENCLGFALLRACHRFPRAPEVLKAHYAPQTPLLLLKEPALESYLTTCLGRGLKVNVWSNSHPIKQHDNLFWQQLPTNSDAVAKILYHQLRLFDGAEADITLIQRPPHSPCWSGVLDRLERAMAHFSLDIRLAELNDNQS